jgi:hypothetical protein
MHTTFWLESLKDHLVEGVRQLRDFVARAPGLDFDLLRLKATSSLRAPKSLRSQNIHFLF